MSVDYSKLVKCPHHNSVNTGLSACKQSTMLSIFGRPGKATTDCSPVTSVKLKKEIITADVGPFNVTGLRKAVASLKDLFDEVRQTDLELYQQVGTAGMLCCRVVRGSTSSFSNHSWGGAIDLKFKGKLDGVGDGKTQLGLLTLYPYFHERGWYWGVEFGKNNPKREDAMHMEVADETMRKWYG